MMYFTKYANDKFDLLNKHKIYLRKEQIEDVVNLPEKTTKSGKCTLFKKDGIEVVCRKEEEILKIITFYPIKN